MTQQTILVVEDDTAIRRGLVDALRYAGYEVLEAADGRRGAAMAVEASIDLVLLDVMLPGRDGYSILDDLRAARPTLPVIMVTARGSEDDRVRGLVSGADDYVIKPFSARELLARVEAVLRRSPERPSDVQSLRLGNMIVRLDRCEVVQGGACCATLSQREAGILRYLAANAGRIISRDELLHRVWGIDPRGVETRTVDMHVARLRDKLAVNEHDTEMIATVRGKGYMLSSEVEIEPR
ncbi:MAG: response regulator transcription factor [Phycisphaerales bacterium]|nr:response regulator transcription factor [Phycisphaerales bacterium]